MHIVPKQVKTIPNLASVELMNLQSVISAQTSFVNNTQDYKLMKLAKNINYKKKKQIMINKL